MEFDSYRLCNTRSPSSASIRACIILSSLVMTTRVTDLLCTPQRLGCRHHLQGQVRTSTESSDIIFMAPSMIIATRLRSRVQICQCHLEGYRLRLCHRIVHSKFQAPTVKVVAFWIVRFPHCCSGLFSSSLTCRSLRLALPHTSDRDTAVRTSARQRMIYSGMSRTGAS